MRTAYAWGVGRDRISTGEQSREDYDPGKTPHGERHSTSGREVKRLQPVVLRLEVVPRIQIGKARHDRSRCRASLPLLGSSRRRPEANQDSPDPEGRLEPQNFEQLALSLRDRVDLCSTLLFTSHMLHRFRLRTANPRHRLFQSNDLLSGTYRGFKPKVQAASTGFAIWLRPHRTGFCRRRGSARTTGRLQPRQGQPDQRQGQPHQQKRPERAVQAYPG